MHSRYWPRLRASGMSVLGGGLNRSTQHSISFSLLGFESQGLAHAASDPKVSVFSAAVKPRKYPRRIVIHSIFPLFRIECCVDRLSWQPEAGIAKPFIASSLCLGGGFPAAGSIDLRFFVAEF